jgi:undecaprenyl-diphosphatase
VNEPDGAPQGSVPPRGGAPELDAEPAVADPLLAEPATETLEGAEHAGGALAVGTLFSAWILGLVQGLTEFLPVSSSGHLVLFQQYLTLAGDHVLFDLVLHLGTLIPVLAFYRHDVLVLLRDPVAGTGPFWQRDGVRMAAWILLATLPTGIIGVLFRDLFEAMFATPAVLAVSFSITGVLLFVSDRFPRRDVEIGQMMWWQAVIIGLAQGIAITPGISRSGTTIVTGLAVGLSPTLAARFSFLISVPAILGAVVLKSRDADLSALDVPALALGFLTAMASGYAALVLLNLIVKRRRLSGFAWYVWCAAAFAAFTALAQGLGWL